VYVYSLLPMSVFKYHYLFYVGVEGKICANRENRAVANTMNLTYFGAISLFEFLDIVKGGEV